MIDLLKKALKRKARSTKLFVKLGLTKVRQSFMRARGVKRFRWITMRDNRVRPLHRKLHGTVVPIGGHPTEGYPGEPFNCRCWAEPIPEPNAPKWPWQTTAEARR